MTSLTTLTASGVAWQILWANALAEGTTSLAETTLLTDL
jgi:hypothetical protein